MTSILLLGLVLGAAGQTADDRRCLQCHGQQRIASDSEQDLRVRVRVDPGQPPPPPRTDQAALFVTRESLAGSVHAGVACVTCHADAAELPHAARLRPADCTSCHQNEADAFAHSAHAAAAARGLANAPRCQTCHGGHDVRPRTDPSSRTFPLHVIRVCGDCHQTHHGGREADEAARVGTYLDSVHGRAVTQSGLIVAATCAACHGHHDVRPSSDPGSAVHRRNIPVTCGRCHVGINEVFAASVHGQAALGATRPADSAGAGSKQAPVCSDCHSSHAITRADTAEFERDMIDECGTCHADLFRTYRESYHGQVQRLGSRRAARCSDCHGAHNIRRPEDPASTLAPARIADTCAGCHSRAHEELRRMSAAGRANFIRYDPHADFRDRRKHPILYYIWLYFIIVISVTFTFWGLHSIAWFVRGTIDRVRSGPPPRHAAHGRAIRRFSAWHRWTHVLVIVSFFGLTLTGLPLKYSDQPWSARLMRMLGGPDSAGFLHRCFAVMVLAYLVMHAIHLVETWRRGNRPFLERVFGPHSMLPMRRDWREFVQMVRWFFGLGEKPRFDRWTYWEKFDYWADMIGTFIIGGSGLLLWFPTFFAEYLSGYWFNVATVVHSYEALLAVGFIFTIHFFNAHLRWEKFPVDDVIFTGQVAEEEFRAERPGQYERLLQTGELEVHRVRPAPQWLRGAARVVAGVTLAIGTLLVVLIAWAGLK